MQRKPDRLKSGKNGQLKWSGVGSINVHLRAGLGWYPVFPEKNEELAGCAKHLPALHQPPRDTNPFSYCWKIGGQEIWGGDRRSGDLQMFFPEAARRKKGVFHRREGRRHVAWIRHQLPNRAVDQHRPGWDTTRLN